MTRPPQPWLEPSRPEIPREFLANSFGLDPDPKSDHRRPLRKLGHMLWVISGVLATIIGVVTVVASTIVAIVALTDQDWPKATAYLLLALLATYAARADK